MTRCLCQAPCSATTTGVSAQIILPTVRGRETRHEWAVRQSASKQFLWDWSLGKDNLGNPITGTGGLRLFCSSLMLPPPSATFSTATLPLADYTRHFSACHRANTRHWSWMTGILPVPHLHFKACGTRWHHLQQEEAQGGRQVMATVSSVVQPLCIWVYD